MIYNLKNVDEYRAMRHNELVCFLRGIEYKENKKILELINDTQVERVKIIKGEHKHYARILHEFDNTKITPVESLEQIDLHKYFNDDYYLKAKSFEED